MEILTLAHELHDRGFDWRGYQLEDFLKDDPDYAEARRTYDDSRRRLARIVAMWALAGVCESPQTTFAYMDRVNREEDKRDRALVKKLSTKRGKSR